MSARIGRSSSAGRTPIGETDDLRPHAVEPDVGADVDREAALDRRGQLAVDVDRTGAVRVQDLGGHALGEHVGRRHQAVPPRPRPARRPATAGTPRWRRSMHRWPASASRRGGVAAGWQSARRALRTGWDRAPRPTGCGRLGPGRSRADRPLQTARRPTTQPMLLVGHRADAGPLSRAEYRWIRSRRSGALTEPPRLRHPDDVNAEPDEGDEQQQVRFEDPDRADQEVPQHERDEQRHGDPR